MRMESVTINNKYWETPTNGVQFIILDVDSQTLQLCQLGIEALFPTFLASPNDQNIKR